ncbi:hypothetical protein KAJ27_18140 [bacterium]|nr:hypothetical protein [bacterium]
MYKCVYIGDEIFSSAINCTGIETVPALTSEDAEETCLRLLKRIDTENYGLIMVEDHLWKGFSKDNTKRFISSVIPVVVPVKRSN